MNLERPVRRAIAAPFIAKGGDAAVPGDDSTPETLGSVSPTAHLVHREVTGAASAA